jgi:uncharacterized protein YegP (UPF0339 family)
MLQIKKAKGGYIVYLKSTNGEILMTSEIIKTVENAIKNASSVVVNVAKFKSILQFGKKHCKECSPYVWEKGYGDNVLTNTVNHFSKLLKDKLKNKPVKKVAATSKAKEKLKAETKTIVPTKKAPKTKPSVKVTIKKNK